MAEVRLTMEEYQALVELSRSGTQQDRRAISSIVRDAKPKPKRKGTPLKGMRSALKKANAKARKKNGSFKKGWTQARVMKEAHRLRRRSK